MTVLLSARLSRNAIHPAIAATVIILIVVCTHTAMSAGDDGPQSILCSYHLNPTILLRHKAGAAVVTASKPQRGNAPDSTGAARAQSSGSARTTDTFDIWKNFEGQEIQPDNKTVLCREKPLSCFTLWTSDPRDESKITMILQGCWLNGQGEHGCSVGRCESKMEPIMLRRYNNTVSKFCCCSGNMCNDNVTDIYDPMIHQKNDDNPKISQRPQYYMDTSYREKTIIIALASVFSVALFIVVTYLAYRMWLRSRSRPFDTMPFIEAPLSPTFKIDDLKLGDLINKGRYSEVWHGRMGDHDVAVKVFTPHYKQFYCAESSIHNLPLMEHDNLVKYYGNEERICADGNLKYMVVLELVPLGSLTSYLRSNTVDWMTLCKMWSSIARGLGHLHMDIRKGDNLKPAIAHRDINSRNILVRPDLSCVIADLGFCMAMYGSKVMKNGQLENAEQSSLTDVGTLRYMSPEILEGAVNLRDCEASLKQIDIYALGLVLWEISKRCSHLYNGHAVNVYELPYQSEVGIHPSFEEMQILVSHNKTRPKFPYLWKEATPCVRAVKETIEDCWDHDAEARLTSLCVDERVQEMIPLWMQQIKHKGVTPTVNPTGDKATVITSTSDNNDSVPADYMTSPGEGRHTDLDRHDVANEAAVSTPLLNQAQRLADAGFQPRSSWTHDMSSSTVETDLPSPLSDSELPLVQPPPPPTKMLNTAPVKNSNVAQPYQGYNPTVERNTHKRSDEELTISGNALVSVKQSNKNTAGVSAPTASIPNSHNSGLLTGATSNEHRSDIMRNSSGVGHSNQSGNSGGGGMSDDGFENFTDTLDSSLVQNDVLNQQPRHSNPPIPYLHNSVQPELGIIQPKQANVTSVSVSACVPSNKTLENNTAAHKEGKKSLFSLFKGPKSLGMKLALFNPLRGKNVDKKTSGEQSMVYPHDVETGSTPTEVRIMNGHTVVRPTSLSVHHPPNSESLVVNTMANLNSCSDIIKDADTQNINQLKSTNCRWVETNLSSPRNLHSCGNHCHGNDPEKEQFDNCMIESDADKCSVDYGRCNGIVADGRLNATDEFDSSEKIRNRVKTPMMVNKEGRLSLCNDRMMASQSWDELASQRTTTSPLPVSSHKPSVSLQHVSSMVTL